MSDPAGKPAGRWRASPWAAPGVEAIAPRGGKALVEEPRQHVGQHRLLPAEKAGAAGDVEHEAEISGKIAGRTLRRGIERHQRRIAVGPVGDRLQQLPVGLRVFVHHLDGGCDGAGIGQAHAAHQPCARRLLIQRDDGERIAAAAGDDERRALRRRGEPPARTVPQPRQTVGRKRG